MRIVTAVVLVFCLCVPIAAVPSLGEADIRARSQAAQRVVVASVLDTAPRFDTNAFGDRVIISQVWLRVEDTWKGSSTPIIVIDLEGGTIGDLTLRVSDLPLLRAGIRGVFFLTSGDGNTAQLSDRGRGFLQIDSSDRLVGTSTTVAALKALAGAAHGGGR